MPKKRRGPPAVRFAFDDGTHATIPAVDVVELLDADAEAMIRSGDATIAAIGRRHKRALAERTAAGGMAAHARSRATDASRKSRATTHGKHLNEAARAWKAPRDDQRLALRITKPAILAMAKQLNARTALTMRILRDIPIAEIEARATAPLRKSLYKE